MLPPAQLLRGAILAWLKKKEYVMNEGIPFKIWAVLGRNTSSSREISLTSCAASHTGDWGNRLLKLFMKTKVCFNWTTWSLYKFERFIFISKCPKLQIFRLKQFDCDTVPVSCYPDWLLWTAAGFNLMPVQMSIICWHYCNINSVCYCFLPKCSGNMSRQHILKCVHWALQRLVALYFVFQV